LRTGATHAALMAAGGSIACSFVGRLRCIVLEVRLVPDFYKSSPIPHDVLLLMVLAGCTAIVIVHGAQRQRLVSQHERAYVYVPPRQAGGLP
jgi:hypothetical protein